MSALVLTLLAGLRLANHVNDEAGVISAHDRVVLTSQLEALERSDGTQVVLLTVPSLGGTSIERFALEVARENGIGQAGTNNGVLLVIAVQDHKMRIEVGKGLEGRLTDAVASQIIRHQMAPLMRAGAYSAGARAGVEAVISAVKGEYVAPADDRAAMDPLALLLLCAACLAAALWCRSADEVGLGWVMAGLWTVPFTVLGHLSPGLALAVPMGITFLGLFGKNRSLFSRFGGASGGGDSGWTSSDSSSSSSAGSTSDFSGGGGDFSGGGASGDW